MPISAFSASQLASPTFATLNNLSWSVFGWFTVPSANYPGYPAYTLWLTVPRSDNAVRSADASRYGATFQVDVKGKMASIFAGAAFISHDLGTQLRITLRLLFASRLRPTRRTFTVFGWGTTVRRQLRGRSMILGRTTVLKLPRRDAFSGVVRSDLYEVRPMDDGHGGTVVDPHTGTTGLAYYVGYFEFNSNGTMTFTRQAASTTPSQVTLKHCPDQQREHDFLSQLQ